MTYYAFYGGIEGRTGVRGPLTADELVTLMRSVGGRSSPSDWYVLGLTPDGIPELTYGSDWL